MERLQATPESYARKIAFIETAMGEDAHQRIPKTYRCKEWERTVDIGLLYNMGPDTTGPSLGNLYGVTRERISKINRCFVLQLHENSSKKTRDKFPLETIPFDKPVSQSMREKRSEAKGGKSLKIKNLINAGVVDPKQIALDLGLSSKQITNARSVLKGWGVDLVRTKEIYSEIKDQVEKETNDKKLQELLDNLSANSLKRFSQEGNKRQQVFIYLGVTLRELGFSQLRSKLVSDKLKSLGIPIRLLEGTADKRKGGKLPTYYVFYAKHEQRVTDVIKQMEIFDKDSKGNKFEKVKIELVCGKPDSKISPPTTFDFQKRINFQTIGGLIKETAGVRITGHNKFNVMDFLSGCPVPVWRYTHNHVIHRSKADEFKAFIKTRYKELIAAKEKNKFRA